jgi:hypothetical protein
LKEFFSFSDQEKWMIVSFILRNRLYFNCISNLIY